MNSNELKFFKKKKNRTLFVLSFSFSLLLIAIIMILVKDLVNNEWVMTFYFLGLFAYLFFVVYIRSKLVVYTMNYYYHSMIEEDLGLLDVSRKLYTQSWLNQFKNAGFKQSYENNDFVLFHQFFKKIPNIGKTGYALVIFVVSKKENFDFYKNDVNIQVERLYDNYEYERRVKKQIIIQFKKYEQYSDDHKKELQEIINFKNGDQVVINFPVGYFVKENKVYYLRPSNKFYNKFHFYASNLIKEFTNSRGDE